MPNWISRRRWLALVLGSTVVGACAGSSAGTDSKLAPAMVVERFLRAANSNDLDTMARLFGTRAGPIAQRESRRMQMTGCSRSRPYCVTPTTRS
jgi:hypothetical protein